MGAVTRPIFLQSDTIILCTGLQLCVDGIPAFSANTKSLKPLDFVNLSLPPTQRTRVENMLLMMLLPTDIKGVQQKKYFDFAANHELNDLFYNGTGALPIYMYIF